MLVTNYPNYKDPTAPFEFQQPQKKIRVKAQTDKTKKIIIKKQSATQSSWKKQNYQKSQTQTQQTPKQSNQQQIDKSRLNTAPAEDENDERSHQSSSQLQFRTQPLNYDYNMNVRSDQIEENWHIIQENKQIINQSDQQRLKKKQKLYQKMQEDLQALQKYKQWSEQVYSNGPDSKDYRAVKQKLESLKNQQDEEEQQQLEAEQQIVQMEQENQKLSQEIEKNTQNLEQLKKQNEDLKKKIQNEKNQQQKYSQNCQMIKSGIPVDQPPPNGKKPPKLKKNEILPKLQSQKQAIDSILNKLNK